MFIKSNWETENRFIVEIKDGENPEWFNPFGGDYVYAEDYEEALSIAKDTLYDSCFIDQPEDFFYEYDPEEIVDSYIYRVYDETGEILLDTALGSEIY